MLVLTGLFGGDRALPGKLIHERTQRSCLQRLAEQRKSVHPHFALHLELFTIRRAPGKLKYLAGSESGMGAFTNDIAPEAAAAKLREDT